MEALDTLKGKLDLLLKKFAAAEKENKRLNGIIANQNSAIDTLSKKVSLLENDKIGGHYENLGISGEEKENMRRQLDTVIGEIDKILVTLND